MDLIRLGKLFEVKVDLISLILSEGSQRLIGRNSRMVIHLTLLDIALPGNPVQ